MNRPSLRKTVDQILDEVYTEMPANEVSEDDIDGMYKQYEATLKEYESSLDPDFDLE
jgi:hypothetical protein